MSELLIGVHRSDDARRARRSAAVEHVLERLPVVPFDAGIARIHASLSATLVSAGTPVDTHDLIIAATALHRSAVVLTANRADFDRVPDLRVLPYPA